jgi:polar amino acid transport system substrate-binding protein
VGVAGSQPFVVSEGQTPGGLSVDVWREVARRTGARFELERIGSVQEAVDRVATGKLDVAVGPISITAKRAQKVSFTQPYFQSSLAIVARRHGAGLAEFLTPFLSKAFIYGTGTLLSVLLLVGVLFWFAERNKNPQMFPGHPVRGIGNGIWLALVTMTTVGYGDRVPVTVSGRVIGGIWMVLAMLSLSSLTAGIATTLTVASLNRSAIASAGELDGKRVAVLRGNTSESFVRKHGARVVPARSVNHALSLVAEGAARAVVEDRPILQYALSHSDFPDLELADSAYEPQGYGFAAASDELARRFDIAILQAAEERRIETITEHWLEGVGGE